MTVMTALSVSVREEERERERGRGRGRGTENEQKRGGASVERENGEERGEAIKTSERCRGCLALFDTFASDNSSPFELWWNSHMVKFLVAN